MRGLARETRWLYPPYGYIIGGTQATIPGHTACRAFQWIDAPTQDTALNVNLRTTQLRATGATIESAKPTTLRHPDCAYIRITAYNAPITEPGRIQLLP